MVVDAARDADAASLGESLEARGDVDAVAEDVAVLDHDVADIDADAEPHAARRVERPVCGCDVALDVDGAFHGGEDAGELGEHAVTGGAADASAMLRDEGVGDGAMGGQRRQRAFLVAAHQPAIALDVGGEDGDELSLERRRFHVGLPIATRRAVSARW
jgi:hypothetical protein